MTEAGGASAQTIPWRHFTAASVVLLSAGVACMFVAAALILLAEISSLVGLLPALGAVLILISQRLIRTTHEPAPRTQAQKAEFADIKRTGRWLILGGLLIGAPIFWYAWEGGSGPAHEAKLYLAGAIIVAFVVVRVWLGRRAARLLISLRVGAFR